MRDLAVITRIQSIEPIKDKDRIEVATVENYQVIVGKGEFKEGDLVVYCFYDTVLPTRPEFEFLRARCYSKMYDGFRIRNMKMAGIYSSGIIFPISILPDGFRISEGKNVEVELGIRKYDPEELREKKEIERTSAQYSKLQLWLIRHCKWYRQRKFGKKAKGIPYPSTVQKSDETNVQKLFDKYKAQFSLMQFYKTEKMEGQAVAYVMQGKGRKRQFHVYSHNVHRGDGRTGNGSWEKVARELNIESVLRSLDTNYCIQGEICGEGIQSNIYGFEGMRLFVYKVTEVNTGRQLNFIELGAFCVDNNLELVPFLSTATLPSTLEQCLVEADGKSVFGKKIKREGIVWRSVTDQHIGFKAKSRKYSVWYEDKIKTE